VRSACGWTVSPITVGIVAFAGEDIELAKYSPEGRRFLLHFERAVTHWEVSAAAE